MSGDDWLFRAYGLDPATLAPIGKEVPRHDDDSVARLSAAAGLATAARVTTAPLTAPVASHDGSSPSDGAGHKQGPETPATTSAVPTAQPDHRGPAEATDLSGLRSPTQVRPRDGTEGWEDSQSVTARPSHPQPVVTRVG